MGEKSKKKGGGNDVSLLGNFVHFMVLFSLLIISLTVTGGKGPGCSHGNGLVLNLAWRAVANCSQHHNSYGLPCRNQEKKYFYVKYIIFHYSSTELSCHR